MRFLADKAILPKTIILLRHLMHDTVHLYGQGLESWPDVAVLHKARAERRFLLTLQGFPASGGWISPGRRFLAKLSGWAVPGADRDKVKHLDRILPMAAGLAKRTGSVLRRQ